MVTIFANFWGKPSWSSFKITISGRWERETRGRQRSIAERAQASENGARQRPDGGARPDRSSRGHPEESRAAEGEGEGAEGRHEDGHLEHGEAAGGTHARSGEGEERVLRQMRTDGRYAFLTLVAMKCTAVPFVTLCAVPRQSLLHFVLAPYRKALRTVPFSRIYAAAVRYEKASTAGSTTRRRKMPCSCRTVPFRNIYNVNGTEFLAHTIRQYGTDGISTVGVGLRRSVPCRTTPSHSVLPTRCSELFILCVLFLPLRIS